MNNNEENITSSTQENEAVIEPKTEAKKLSRGALIGIIGGGVALVVAVVLIVVLLAGGKCKSHIDQNSDGACDKCGEAINTAPGGQQTPGDGDQTPGGSEGDDSGDETEATSAEITFQVQLDNGDVISDIGFKIYNNKQSYELISGADGNAKCEVKFGTYYVDFDLETLPEFCWGETEKVSINKDSTTVILVISDSRPDGSVNKPYYVSDEPVDITLQAGQEIFFNYRGNTAKFVRVYHESAVVCYNGEEYPAVDGATNLLIEPDSIAGGYMLFSIKNTSDTEFTAKMEVIAPLGTSENPYEMIGNSLSVSLLPESIVYYKWVADKDGILVVNTSTLDSEISVTKILDGDVPISSSTYGEYYAYLSVKAGDVVTVSISALAPHEHSFINGECECGATNYSGRSTSDDTVTDTPVEINIDFVVCAGTDTDPVPVLKSYTDISFDAGSSITFLGEAGKTVTIEAEPDACILYNGQTVTPDADGNITVTLTDSLWFTVVNNSDTINGIAFEIK